MPSAGPETVSVLICTYGPDRAKWSRFAERARASVEKQTRQPDQLIEMHHDSGMLHEVRNAAAAAARTDAIIFLDADDELDPGYVEAMMAGTGDIRYPLVQRLCEETGQWIDKAPRAFPKKTILLANFLVVSSMMPRETFLAAGGFEDYPALEDWSLFINLIQRWHLKPELCPGAILHYHVRADGRNQIDTITAAKIQKHIRKQAQERLPIVKC